MSKELKISNVLDKHLSPIQIDGAIVPIEISTEAIRFNKTTTIQEDLIVEGDLSVKGGFSSLDFTSEISISSESAEGYLTMTALGFQVLSNAYKGEDGDLSDNDSEIVLMSSSGYDSYIKLYNATGLAWSVGNDGSDSNKFCFDYNNVLGAATKLSLDGSGNLTAANSVVVGNATLTTNELDISSGDFVIDSAGTISLDMTDRCHFKNAGTPFANIQVDTASQFTLYEQGGASQNDYFQISTATHGATTLATVDAAAAAANLTMTIDGGITLDSAGEIVIDHTDRFKFKKAGTEYILFDVDSTSQFTMYEQGGSSTDDYFKIVCATSGATTLSTVDAAGTSGDLTITADGELKLDAAADHHIHLGKGTGFTQVVPTYNATDTDVDFRDSNKQFVTFGAGNIADLNLKFPALSGNFTLLLKQDGTGSRTIAADGYLVFDSAGNAAAGSSTVKFAGGSNPTLTTDANHVDIISFYWDATNEIAYGVASLDFQF